MDLNRILDDVLGFTVDNFKDINNRLFKLETHSDGVDVTTSIDKEVESKFYDYVCKKYPEFGFEGEEFPEHLSNKEYNWYIDPIDGSKYFAAGIPLWCSTVALVDKTQNPLLGFIYNPLTNQVYKAIKDGGAYLNNKRINISAETSPKKLQVCVDLANHVFEWGDLSNELSAYQSILSSLFYRVRMLGSGALSLAWLAQGFFGVFFDFARRNEKIIDIAAGLLIAKEAGAIIYSEEIHKGVRRTIVAKKEVVDKILSTYTNFNSTI